MLSPSWATPARAIDLEGTTEVTLNWAPASGNVAGYQLLASIDGGPEFGIAFALGTTTTLSHPGFVPGISLVFRARAVDAQGNTGPFSLPSEVIRFATRPVLTPVPDQQLGAAQSVSIPLQASDADGDTLRLTSPNLPGFASLSDFGNGNGALLLTPGAADSGSYDITLVATDDGTPNLFDSTVVRVTVDGGAPGSPVFTPMGPQVIPELRTFIRSISAVQPGGRIPVLTAPELPSFASFVDLGNGLGRLTATPGFDDGGVHRLTVIATDSSDPTLTTSLSFDLTVIELNRPPSINAPASVVAQQGQPLSVPVFGSDPDGTPVSFVAIVGQQILTILPGLPGGLVFIPVPAEFTLGGDFVINLLLLDSGIPILLAQEFVAVSVVASSAAAPVLQSIADIDMREGTGQSIPLAVSNAAVASFEFSASGMPGFASLSDFGDGSGALLLQPGWGTRGIFDITISAHNSADPLLSDSQTLRLTVGAIRIVTADRAADELVVLDPVTGFTEAFHQNFYPIDLGADAAGNLYVLRGLGNGFPPAVILADPFQRFARSVTEGGLLNAVNHGPTAMAVRADGSIYVAVVDLDINGLTQRIVRVDPSTGAQELVSEDGALFYPFAMTFGHDDLLYVGDPGAHRVIAIDPDVGTQYELATLSNVGAMAPLDAEHLIVGSGLTSAFDGELWTLNTLTGELQLHSADNLLASPSGIASQAGGDSVVVQSFSPNLTLVDPETGRQRSFPIRGNSHDGVVIVDAP